MKQFQLKPIFVAVAILSVLSACKKERVNTVTEIPQTGVYILSQGNIGKNNSVLSFYNSITKNTTSDIFSSVNNRGIGDTGNDAKIYGSKMYIVVNYSSTLEIVDAKTTKSIKQIKMENGGTNRQPRYVVFDKNKAYISSYDGTVAVLDTASLTIEKYIAVGRNPEQMVVSNGKLYVANSGGLSYPNYDKTVSVINLTTLTEMKKIEVILNPGTMAADNYGNVYVLSTGNYKDIAPGMTVINNITDVVKSQSTLAGAYGSSMVVNGDFAYLISATNNILVYNVKKQAVEKQTFITDGTKMTAPLNIALDPVTGEVFVTDAIDYINNGKLFVFDKTGKLEYDVKTGISPGAVVVLK